MNVKNKQPNMVSRPPVVAVLGHIDHGKSTLLDYIRKSNVVAGEAGGITQHLSAYEVVHKDEHGVDKKITFIDTPGHEAFSGMRERGAGAANIGILVVSAEDGVKTQTKEALATILASKIPYIVAINKIDKEGADLEKTKMNLAENEIFIEGFGGSIPYVAISSKTGAGIDDLLSMILLVDEMAEDKADTNSNASGVVIESHLDPKRGVTATLIIKDGTLKKGMYVVAGNSIVGTRIFESFLGKQIDEATFSTPIVLSGFDTMPPAGSAFTSFENKKEAEEQIKENKNNGSERKNRIENLGETKVKLLPIIIKTDVSGTMEAIQKELSKMNQDTVAWKVISSGVGSISENDVKTALSDPSTIIVGFGVKSDAKARELAEQNGIQILNFDIIYKLSEFLAENIESRRPRVQSEEVEGKAKILKIFNKTRDRTVAGARVLEGHIAEGSLVKIMRRDFEIDRGRIIGLEKSKVKTKQAETGEEFGMLLELKVEIAPGDTVESFVMTSK